MTDDNSQRDQRTDEGGKSDHSSASDQEPQSETTREKDTTVDKETTVDQETTADDDPGNDEGASGSRDRSASAHPPPTDSRPDETPATPTGDEPSAPVEEQTPVAGELSDGFGNRTDDSSGDGESAVDAVESAVREAAARGDSPDPAAHMDGGDTVVAGDPVDQSNAEIPTTDTASVPDEPDRRGDVGDGPASEEAESGGRSETEPGGPLDVGLDDVVMDGENEASQGLFDDLLSGEQIFENKEVLRPSYTPHELPHRKNQINNMATILVSALRGDTPSNILIYGKTGTGKTASAKFVSQELEETSGRYDVACNVHHINCEVTDTQYRVLAQLANKFIEENQSFLDGQLAQLQELREEATEDPSVLAESPFGSLEQLDGRIQELQSDRDEMEPVPMTGWPTDRVYSEFFDAVDYRERVVVIMLDEIDKLVEKSGDDTLYNLSRMNTDLENSRVSIIGISNDLKFTDFLDPRVKSSLGEEEIVFPPYDANQLRDILHHRADVSFQDGVLTDDVIPLCAAFAAQEHGDARRALDLLRTAGELAEQEGVAEITEGHVRGAQNKIELNRVVEVVRTLPTQSKIVLYSIILLEDNGAENINTGEVYNIYKQVCDEIDADTLTQRRVTDLISELDMLGIVNAVVVSKGRYGRTKEISISVPIGETEAVLQADSRIGDIDNDRMFVK